MWSVGDIIRRIGVSLVTRYIRSLGHYDLVQRRAVFRAIQEGHIKAYPSDNMYDKHYSLVLWLTQATPYITKADADALGGVASEASLRAVEYAKWNAEHGCSPPLYPV